MLYEESRSAGTNATSAWLSRSERTCASSDGGPGRKRGEHIAGRSTFGTVKIQNSAVSTQARTSMHTRTHRGTPRQPRRARALRSPPSHRTQSLSRRGVPARSHPPSISILWVDARAVSVSLGRTYQPACRQVVVLPHYSVHSPTLTAASLLSSNARPSGRISSRTKRSRYTRGCRRWNTAALSASWSSCGRLCVWSSPAGGAMTNEVATDAIALLCA